MLLNGTCYILTTTTVLGESRCNNAMIILQRLNVKRICTVFNDAHLQKLQSLDVSIRYVLGYLLIGDTHYIFTIAIPFE